MDSSQILGSLLGFVLLGGALIAFIALIYGLINFVMYIFNRLIQGGKRIYLVYVVITVEEWNRVATQTGLSRVDLIQVMRTLFQGSNSPVSWRKARKLARQEKFGYVLLKAPTAKSEDAVNFVIAFLASQGISDRQWKILREQKAYVIPSSIAQYGHASLVIIGFIPTPLPFVILPKPGFD